MDAYEHLLQKFGNLDNLPRDTEGERRLAVDERAILTAIKQMAERGEISVQSASIMTAYISGMSETVKLCKNVEQ